MATTKKTTAAAKPAAKSTAVAVKKAGGAVAIANIQEALRAQAEANAARVEPGGGKSIRIGQDKSFTLPDGTKTREALALVVVDFVSRNEYYEGAYNKDDIVPPNCIAIHPEPKGMVPLASSPDKQCDDCASCPMNQFGSAPTGSGKACKNTRVLAVMPPDADEDTEIWTLKVSPTGIKAFDNFVASTNRTFQLPPVGVVVTVNFSDGKDYPCLEFTDPQPNDNVAVHFARQNEAREMLMREPDFSGFGAEKPAKAKAPARRAAPSAGRRVAAR